jgi:hypothetical protein
MRRSYGKVDTFLIEGTVFGLVLVLQTIYITSYECQATTSYYKRCNYDSENKQLKFSLSETNSGDYSSVRMSGQVRLLQNAAIFLRYRIEDNVSERLIGFFPCKAANTFILIRFLCIPSTSFTVSYSNISE